VDRIVIVGSGAAGAIIATRASENADRDVVLIEAGPDYKTDAEIPSDIRNGTRNSMTAHDWGYEHKPTREGGVMPYPRGRVVGGSTAVNTCIAIRGQDYDYDEWGARGLPGWSFEECLPAFKRLETDLDFGDAPYHGKSGPIPVRRHPKSELAIFQAAFLEACAELSFTPCEDSNAPGSTGFGPHAMNKIDGERMGAARCYLTSKVRSRKNLLVESNAHVVRVLFTGKRATGVEIMRDGKLETIEAALVVLAGGAIGTPMILLRSGIGPADILARHGVPAVRVHPGVGAKLLDHPGCAVFFAPKPGIVKPSDPLIQTVCRYRAENSPLENEMQIQPGSFTPLLGTVPFVSLMCSVGKPDGTSRIAFPSLALDAKPRIDTHFLEDPRDLAKAVEAVELMWLLASTSALRDVVHHLIPGERAFRNRATIASWIRKQTGSGYHPCGTVPMGPQSDPFAPCDERGRVRGVEGLVVADASLMPTVPSANTNLPTMMIGERFGEWIRDGAIAP